MQGIEDIIDPSEKKALIDVMKKYDLKKENIWIRQGHVSWLEINGKNLNKIPDDLKIFSKLENIKLNKNQITSMEGLKDLPPIKELYLSNNQISKLEGLENLPILRWLEVFNNKITTYCF